MKIQNTYTESINTYHQSFSSNISNMMTFKDSMMRLQSCNMHYLVYVVPTIVQLHILDIY